MTDFLDEKRKEIQTRLKELKPLVDEYQRLRPPSARSPESAQRRVAGRPRRAPRAHGLERPPRASEGIGDTRASRRSNWSAPARDHDPGARRGDGDQAELPLPGHAERRGADEGRVAGARQGAWATAAARERAAAGARSSPAKVHTSRFTASRSSTSSATVSSIRSREKSVTRGPARSPTRRRTAVREHEMIPSRRRRRRRGHRHRDPVALRRPETQSRTWSIAALAAEAALDAPRASMIAAPRLPRGGCSRAEPLGSSTTSAPGARRLSR